MWGIADRGLKSNQFHIQVTKFDSGVFKPGPYDTELIDVYTKI